MEKVRKLFIQNLIFAQNRGHSRARESHLKSASRKSKKCKAEIPEEVVRKQNVFGGRCDERRSLTSQNASSEHVRSKVDPLDASWHTVAKLVDGERAFATVRRQK